MAIKLKTEKITQGDNHVIYSNLITEKELGTVNGRGWVRFYPHTDASQVSVGYADINSVIHIRYCDIEFGDGVDAQYIGNVQNEFQIVTLVTFTAEFDNPEE